MRTKAAGRRQVCKLGSYYMHVCYNEALPSLPLAPAQTQILPNAEGF